MLEGIAVVTGAGEKYASLSPPAVKMALDRLMLNIGKRVGLAVNVHLPTQLRAQRELYSQI